MPYEDIANILLTDNDVEAENRASEFRDRDPFPNVPRALLSKEHVSDYVRVTGMLCPFFPSDERLKAASYEAWPKRFIRWDETGRKIIHEVDPKDYERHGYELLANSITFVQIESRIRLPNYIALRFNLRITHVHRGLLLGTGPLVDPGFSGDLLIPLHNLTSDTYRMRGGVIWIEFTKTSQNEAPPSDFERKRNRGFEYYFERASGNNPIQSSIPLAIKDAQKSAQEAKTDARRAVRTNYFFASLGFLAILGMIVAAANFGVSVVRDSSVVGKDASLAIAEARRLAVEQGVLRKELDEARRSLSIAETAIRNLRSQLDRLQSAPPSQNRP